MLGWRRAPGFCSLADNKKHLSSFQGQVRNLRYHLADVDRFAPAVARLVIAAVFRARLTGNGQRFCFVRAGSDLLRCFGRKGFYLCKVGSIRPAAAERMREAALWEYSETISF